MPRSICAGDIYIEDTGRGARCLRGTSPGRTSASTLAGLRSRPCSTLSPTVTYSSSTSLPGGAPERETN